MITNQDPASKRSTFALRHILRPKSLQVVERCTDPLAFYFSMMQLLTVVCTFRVPSAVYRFDFHQMRMHGVMCCHILVATNIHSIKNIDRMDYYRSCYYRPESFSEEETNEKCMKSQMNLWKKQINEQFV